ncbi:hypothetical protein [Asaia platycodi]|uniref:hypothetical protein n=1 Tax=Asaia platycodi TaxID=610243 RepID=UPI001F55D9AE|nr:hypothetical protein [Asaia platycodi]
MIAYVFCMTITARASDDEPQPKREQWYTGSLISPSGPQFKAGVLGIEPYLTYNQAVDYLGANGASAPMDGGQRTVSNSTMVKYGLTDHISIQIFPAISYGWKKHDGNTSGLKFGDMPVDFLWRFLDPDPKRYIPVMSLFVGMLMPTGDYSNLAAVRTVWVTVPMFSARRWSSNRPTNWLMTIRCACACGARSGVRSARRNSWT